MDSDIKDKNGIDKGKINKLIYERDDKPFGKTWEEWAALWWQWCSAEPDDSNPVADMTGEICGKNQNHSDVWFLAGTFGGRAERRCTIPAGKAIFFPIINDLISYAEYNFLVTEADLRAYAKSDLDQATIYNALVDGLELRNLEKYRVQSQLFSFRMPPHKLGEKFICQSQGISEGYWVFLRPLRVGQHTIHFVGEKLKFDEIRHSNFKAGKPKFRVEVTYYLTVK
jgi:hypothetical protein